MTAHLAPAARRVRARGAAVLALALAGALVLAGCSDEGEGTPSPSSSRPVKAEVEPTAPTGVAALEGLDVEPVADVTLVTADADQRQGAAAVAKTVGSVVRDPVVRGVRRGGDVVGWVVVWSAPAGATSEIFRTQFVIQLASARPGGKVQPRPARIGETPVAVIGGKSPAAAWFDGDRPALLVVKKGEDAASLAAALRGKLPAR